MHHLIPPGGGQQLNRLAPQQQPYNQPFQQFQQPAQFPAQPITSGSGDIVLQPESRKNHKKWIIVVVVVVLCAALTILLVSISFRNNEIISSQDLSEINEKISNFSSTIMYGDGRQVDLSTSTYSDTVDYKFRREIMSGNQEYIEKVINEFNSLNNLIIEDKNLSLTDDDKNYLKVYRDKLHFLEIYIDSSNEDYSIIIDKIINDGKDKTISYLETQYSEYIDSDNTSLSDYFLYKIEHEKLSIDILLRTDIGECTTDDIVSASCEVEPLMTDEETLQMQEIEDEMRIIVIANIKYIINGCWDIYDLVNGVKNV